MTTELLEPPTTGVSRTETQVDPTEITGSIAQNMVGVDLVIRRPSGRVMITF